ncbi:RNA polymerase sigma factor SigY [Jeotgalibacillus proteolyticus]|uniref:RNA polymerase sigma factor SigY n=1 Tax=Jeotgalibacillus proteolyticus TaxID=2082395 RepID=UPI001431EB01|nr:RNA polymerase sigma factor SigY [Jeotgalibacillus proteolyticus]
MNDQDHQLIRQALKGNDKALAELLQHHYRFLFLYVLKLTLHPSAAEDLAQDTMVRCIERFYQFDPTRAAFSTWMIQIATNLWLDEKRKRKRERNYFNEQQLSFKLHHPGNNDDWLAVTEALKKLKDKHRIPLILKHYYGYSYEDIALICSISIGTVKSRLSNALGKLRKELEEDGSKKRE